jgi:peptide/nickel transport system substrate-binding protein
MKSKARRTRTAAALVTVVGILLATAACTAPASPSDGARDVTLSLGFAPITLDPCNSVAGATGTILRENITETLTEFDSTNGDILPKLATAWEMTSPTEWLFHLREGVTFHDGTPFTADTVITALKRDTDPALNCINFVNQYLNTVTSMEAVDDLTLKITTSEPTPTLPAQLAKEDIGAPSTPSGEFTNEPIGTGPYQLSDYEPQRQVKLEPYSGYWGDRPTFDSVTYMFQADPAARVAQVQSGQADFTIGLPTQFATEKGAVTSPISQVLFLSFETAKAPLDDVRIRQAINMAIDRDGLIKAAYDGYGEPASQIVIAGIVGHADDLKPWPYDPDGAKALVEEAKADGVDVDTEILIPTLQNYESTNGTIIAEFVQSDLAAIGLNTKVQVVDQVAWTDLTKKPFGPADRQPSLLVYAHGNSMGDAGLSWTTYLSSAGEQSHVDDPQVDDLIAKGVVATGDERKQLLEQANVRAMTKIIPMAPLVYESTIGMLGGGLKYDFPPNTGDEIHLNEMHY